jgi:hypothetical protein
VNKNYLKKLPPMRYENILSLECSWSQTEDLFNYFFQKALQFNKTSISLGLGVHLGIDSPAILWENGAGSIKSDLLLTKDISLTGYER